MQASRARTLSAVALAATLLASCGTQPTAPVDEQAATAAAGYGRAFGRVAFVDNGEERDTSTSLLPDDRLTVFVREKRTGQMEYMDIEGDGHFLWPLRAGEYVIVAYQYRKGSARRSQRIWTTFSVPGPGQAVYIGDLRIVSSKGRSGFAIQDRYADALTRNEAHLRQSSMVAARGLMQREARLGTYRHVTGICTQQWGVLCDDHFRGVQPLRPDGSGQGFPAAESLTPVLEWKPSSKPGVTYDVAVYESLTFAYGFTGSAPRILGERVAYAEGLKEPRYTLATPLLPDRNYQWSVRLRDGDVVSTWSTTSHFLFLVVAWSRGSGQMFGFSTPGR
jgi:hypothetical protein